jgi:acetylornithine deacetylase/succinyl-diaminopimelate desuccinylase-like protein
MPVAEKAGNVTLPWVRARLSLRLPPPVDGKKAAALLKQLLEDDPPYNSRVNFIPDSIMNGWRIPGIAPWLRGAARTASRIFFGREAVNYGEGGSIDFMKVLGNAYPKAQMLVTGVLGPGSNAHGPNESLDLGMARKLTMCLAHIISEHAGRRTG